MSRKTLISIFIITVAAALFAAFFAYQPLWGKYSSFRPWSLGLDLAGGSFLIYEIDLDRIEVDDQDLVVNGLRDVIERRVNIFGVSEPRIYTQDVAGSRRLVVELAGIKNVNEAIQLIGETPVLDFREVETSEEIQGSVNDNGENTTTTETTLIFKPTLLTGRYIKGAQVVFDQYTGEPQIYLEFNKEGAGIFEEVTGRNIGEPLCIFLDNEIRSFEDDCPIVQSKISGGSAQITGRFTFDEARAIAERFNAGALPAPIKLINQHTISPALGHDSLDKIITAGIWGLALVALYMVIYYRRLGIFAVVALLMYVALLLGIFKLIPVTLTLAGIAGIILSVGMAVDANILVFERTKEELKRGVPYVMAVETGFKRAWTSIRDSNITTIISSVILYYITTSFVRGFALALLIGVLVSMFSAITITRTLLRIFAKKGK